MQKDMYKDRSMEDSMDCPLRLGYATVPLQRAHTIYDYASALAHGTLFPELNIPQGKYGPGEIVK
ncbi:MAG: spore coat associated protein CotJA [Bacillota bacterium]|jgi:hypothetical protein